MSDLLTHWALFEDSRRLASLDDRIDQRWSQLLEEKRSIGRLGAITRRGHELVPPVLEETRRRIEQGQPVEGRAADKLAFALGLVTHYAADVVLKKLMKRLAGADWDATHKEMQKGKTGKPEIREISAYYDCHVFRRVYADGTREPFSKSFFAEGQSATEAFIRSMFQRTVLSAHTFAPEVGDDVGWLDRFLDALQPLYIEMDLYRRVYADPDPAKLKAYAVETQFYDVSDPLLQLAESVGRGEATTPDQLHQSLRPRDGRTGYAAALELSLTRLRETSEYLTGGRSELPSVRQ